MPAGPISLTMSVAQVLPDIQTDLTPAACRCAGSTLYLASQNGAMFTFAKS